MLLSLYFASYFSLTNAHAEDSLLPALDDLTHADLELEGLAAVIARVELLAVGQGARVVHREHVPILGHPLAGLGFTDVLHAQPARGHLEHTGVTKGKKLKATQFWGQRGESVSVSEPRYFCRVRIRYCFHLEPGHLSKNDWQELKIYRFLLSNPYSNRFHQHFNRYL